MSLLSEFREFAVRGNVIDLAVGVIVGGAFGGVTSSLVKDVLMPPLGMLTGGIDFSNQSILLKAAAEGAPAVTLNYGMFIQTLINFVIVAFAVFLLVKAINTLHRQNKAAPAPSAPPADVQLLTEIRDLLREKQ